MRNSKKVVLSVSLVLSIILLLSVVCFLFVPNEDMEVRRELAGTLDFLIVGASQAQNAFVPSIIDEGMNCNSYNLSIASMTNADRYIMLKKELGRNPVNTVVLEISATAMERPLKNDAADGNYHMFMRFETLGEKLDYLLFHTPFDNWPYLYARGVLTSASSIALGENYDRGVDEKGFFAQNSKNCTIPKDQIESRYHQYCISVDDYNADSVAEFDKMIELCKTQGVDRIIVAVVPVADSYIWEYDGMDTFREWIEEYCAKTEIELYDFNLSKQRYQTFNDTESYGSNSDHMSKKGAAAFSKLFVDTINQTDNAPLNVQDEFYNSYEEMLKDSPYLK